MKKVEIAPNRLFATPNSQEELLEQLEALGREGLMGGMFTWNYLSGVTDEFFNQPGDKCPCCGSKLDD